jgi:4-carboxymuconolactone decarboxylase
VLQDGDDAAVRGGGIVMPMDGETRGLLRVALGIFDAPEAVLEERMRVARAGGTPAIWLEELILESVLFVGYPRALVAAGVFRRIEPEHAGDGEPSQYEGWREWLARGEATCRVIYRQHYDRLRHNVRALHPALDTWMIVDGYGKTVSRPGLDLPRRELCAVAMLLAQDAPRQLLSHFVGAVNVGAGLDAVDSLMALAAREGLPEARFAVAGQLWRELRAAHEAA